MRTLNIFIYLCFGFLANALAQPTLTPEEIWGPKFTPARVNELRWMADGLHYTELDQDQKGILILKYAITTGKVVDTIFNSSVNTFDGTPIYPSDYSFSAKENKILLETEATPIYRHSYVAEYFIFDLKMKRVSRVSNGGKQGYATFNTTADKVAFVRNNNVFVYDVFGEKETQLTANGKTNEIINGSTDWVNEEEFGFAKGFFWNSEGTHIAYYTFDETEVKEYNMQEWKNKLYPTDYKFKYPKAGETNSKVSLSIYEVASANTVKVKLNLPADGYIPRVMWTNNPQILSVRTLNRLQNELNLFHVNASNGAATLVLSEKNNNYVEINDELKYLNDGKTFVWASEAGGYNQLFRYDFTGKLISTITPLTVEMEKVNGIDEAKKLVYFTGIPRGKFQERQIYVVGFDGKNLKQISKGAGWHAIDMSPSTAYYIDSYADINTPATITVNNNQGAVIKTLETNERLKGVLAEYKLQKAEFFTFKTTDGVSLTGWMIKPEGFDPTKKYPVLQHFYGGPGHQEAVDNYESRNYLWYQMLAKKGYIVVCVDNRGVPGFGNEFKKATYANLGKLELQDQIEVAKYLGKQTYVDKDRIGVWGWSFGGYLTSLCLTKGAEYFKLGIAVAPVTNWRFYDSIYTERFLKTPQDNATGYDENSPINYARMLKGKFLLIHGTGDDNVHVQNTIAFSDALIKANKQFDLMIYPDRNHGIYGGPTRLHLYRKMTDYILNNL